MDTRDTPEQAELRRSARRLARDLGPENVASLDLAARRERLARAVRDAGWLNLRDDDGEGRPLASGVEAAIVAEALGARVADVPFAGPVLAADLARRAGVSADVATSLAFSSSLIEPAVASGPTCAEPLFAVDGPAEGAEEAWILLAGSDGSSLGRVDLSPQDAGRGGSDLTRRIRTIPAGASIRTTDRPARLLGEDDLAAWTALGLALTSADLVGVMRGVIDVTVDYASQRRQYGVSIGSFQAVQHLLAEARCLLEGASSIALYASWAVDHLAPAEARQAGRAAKAYCARAARTVCETAVQVHGGIGNTWECIVHVHLRRALLSTQWFGDDGEQLRELQLERLGGDDGLP